MAERARETADQRPWTFETLAEADRATLDRVLNDALPPEPARLEGWLYRGWNRAWAATITGRKFEKEFYRRSGATWGCNRLVHRDRSGPRGEWRPKARDRPARIGHYRLVPASERRRGRVGDRHRDLALLDYGVDLNRGLQLPLRVIRDFVCCPNPGDHELLLGKAYLRFLHPRLMVFCTFFVLGHREPIADEGR